jgi:hypothetical protein
MKVSAEPVTMLRHGEQPEITLLMGGHRITLSLEEARALVDALKPAVSAGSLDDERQRAHKPTDAPDPLLREPRAEETTIVARVAEQLVSWSQIANALNLRK